MYTQEYRMIVYTHREMTTMTMHIHQIPDENTLQNIANNVNDYYSNKK